MASRRLEFGADLAAGLAVALIVIPQGIAYALIAGMPPVTGIYASVLPALVYAMIGTSTTQSVGPQSVTALLVATVLAPLAVPASGLYVALAGQLALMTGLVLLIGAALRAGALLEYLSRPVMSGFINGAVLLICAGQLDALLGLREARVHVPSALLGGVCLMLLLLAARRGAALGPAWMRTVSRLAPLAVLVGSVVLLAVPLFAELGIGRVGGVPRGLPDLGLPSPHIGHARNLIVPALLVAVIVFLQSMASAQVLAR